ncbi:MAG: class I tRNA ligase family protein, partial [Firmicutes bacterium]|nr:class I tRNA ligase family protein [Bacillota bacterium]
ERFQKVYLRWLYEIRDWCISRQLWWGHRIPAWYCDDCGEVIVSEEDPTVCPKCGGKHLHQDEDVLDTWFSSALWPFSTLGWPEKTKDLEYFYPTDVLVTGYDIIFFWVVRMVFSGCEAMGEPPFKYVYVHGLVRDAEGRKMSKSLGNGIDPLEEIDKYGADALRFMLTTGITPGNDMRYKIDRLLNSRNFANKLWNASRYVIMNLQSAGEDDALSAGGAAESGADFLPLADGEGKGFDGTSDFSGIALRDEDKWMISRLNDAVRYVTDELDKFDLALAGQRVYDLIWNEYCDWYIEITKKRLYGDDEEDKKVARFVLVMVLKNMLELLHPFMPFITEEIWSFLPHSDKESEYLIKASWPVWSEGRDFPVEEKNLEMAMEAVTAVRNIRAEADAAPSKKLTAVILAEGDALETLKSGQRYIEELAGISEISFVTDKTGVPEDAMSKVISHAQIFIPLAELVDFAEELKRLTKEKQRLEGEVARAEKKLANQGFIAKAPENLIQAERDKEKQYKEMLAKVDEQIADVEKRL